MLRRTGCRGGRSAPPCHCPRSPAACTGTQHPSASPARRAAPCSARLPPPLAQVDGYSVEVALQWCSDAFSDTIIGFVNSIKVRQCFGLLVGGVEWWGWRPTPSPASSAASRCGLDGQAADERCPPRRQVLLQQQGWTGSGCGAGMSAEEEAGCACWHSKGCARRRLLSAPCHTACSLARPLSPPRARPLMAARTSMAPRSR